MGYIIGLIIACAVIYWIIVGVGWLATAIFSALVLLSINSLVGAEGFLSSWSGVPPMVSWGMTALMAGSVLHFAVLESDKLNRPLVRPLSIAGGVILLLLIPFMGPGTKHLFSSKTWLPERRAASLGTPRSELEDSKETAGQPATPAPKAAPGQGAKPPVGGGLEARVGKALADGGFPNLSVREFEGGVVIISGQIGQTQDKAEVQRLARQVPGVSRVESHVEPAVKVKIPRPSQK
jgi:hypothetical protein